MQVERFFASMGTSAHILLVEPPPSRLDVQRAEVLIDLTQTMLSDLERRWSRFRSDSELSHLNATPDIPVMVSPDTFEVISLAVEAWMATGGLFDPTVLDAVIDAGYDRSFDQVSGGRAREHGQSVVSTEANPDHVGQGSGVQLMQMVDRSSHPTPGCAEIVLDPNLCSVTVPHGVKLDLGGVGKGHAADLVALEMIGNGVSGVCVDLGGDIRVMGTGPEDGAWILGIKHPLEPDSELAAVALVGGAVATSARSNRCWVTSEGQAHHLIDPATGTPAYTGLVSVTVVAGEAARAEILSKAAFVAGLDRGAELIAEAGAAGLMVTDDGSVVRTGDFARFEI